MPKINFQLKLDSSAPKILEIVQKILKDTPKLQKLVQVKRFVLEELAIQKYFGVKLDPSKDNKEKERLFALSYEKMGKSEKELFQIWQLSLVDDENSLDQEIPLSEALLLIVKLKLVPGVTFVSLEQTYKVASPDPNDPYYVDKKQSALQKIECSDAWEITKGAGVLVAVVDTGIYSDHDDIDLNLAVDVDGSPLQGLYITNEANPNMDDTLRHGTHVAGIIAAEGNNSIGITGVAPEAKIIPIKVFNTLGSTTSADIARAIYFAELAGAHVINNSWYHQTRISGALDLANLNDHALFTAVNFVIEQKVVCVFAAGNDMRRIDNYWLLRVPHAIVVAATDDTDKRVTSSNFSNRMTIAAPGYQIYSLDTIQNAYFLSTGTSMAAAHVSGAIALFISKNGRTRIHASSIIPLLRSDIYSDDIGVPRVGGYRINCRKLLI